MDPSSTSANAEAAMSGAGGVPTGQSREGLGGNGAKVRQCCFSFVCGKKNGCGGADEPEKHAEGGGGCGRNRSALFRTRDISVLLLLVIL
jgi:hypothetical protein